LANGIIKVQIIQPLIPLYREPIFRRLSECEGLQIKVCASRTVPGIDNLSSVENGAKYADLEHPCIGWLGDRILWQRKMRLDTDMIEGDVLVVCGDMHYFSNIPLIWMAWKRKVGIVWWGHGFAKNRNRFKDFLTRFNMRLVDVRLLYTDKEVDNYRKLGFPANKLFSTNNALDVEPIHQAIVSWTPERLAEFSERHRIAGKHVLLFCGRRICTVDLPLVFSALKRMNSINDKYILAIIGPDESGKALGESARCLGLGDCVRWLGPIFDQSDLAPWFLSAKCFVFPGSIGLSLIHAFAYGLPVILPDCIHNPEISVFRNGENGFYYSDGNEDDLIQKILLIVSDSQLRHDMSNSARNSVENHLSINNMVKRFVSAIETASHASFT
jgi:glycosyltransferase involved in cell wall biosynthesis